MGHTGPVKASAHYPGHPRPAPVPAWARLLPLVLVLVLAACGTAPKRGPAPAAAAPKVVDVAPEDPARANEVLMRALGLVGTPYRYGGNTPSGGFDCSGLVGFVFLDAARVYLPRTTKEIARYKARVPPDDRLAAGDLVLFADKGNIFHVGIYVGEGRFVHAPSTGGTVRLDRIDGPYWGRHYAGARRILY
ncbi:C40 family peptidase [Arenimonas sp.]|uniref:C40 family peptidase n=1 Tax=Arenimonas sp. TaxID=1872635 RepID=UPI0025E0DA41|nr:C40 family peptidase [Arenimonas sp.]